MTVKELKEILDSCNEDAVVFLEDNIGGISLQADMIFATPDGYQVILNSHCEDEE